MLAIDSNILERDFLRSGNVKSAKFSVPVLFEADTYFLNYMFIMSALYFSMWLKTYIRISIVLTSQQ